MSTPYRPHSEYRPPYVLPHREMKRRPSALWFVLGGVLMGAAVVLFAVTIVGFARTVTHTDASFRAAGAHAVSLPAATERGLYVPEGGTIPACQVRDGSGDDLHFRRPDARFTYDGWVAVRVFDTGDGQVVFRCPSVAQGTIRIAEVPSDGDLARLGFLGVLIPLVLGGLGFVVMLVTGILWYSRRPHQPMPAYGVPAGPAYGATPGYPPPYPAAPAQPAPQVPLQSNPPGEPPVSGESPPPA